MNNTVMRDKRSTTHNIYQFTNTSNPVWIRCAESSVVNGLCNCVLNIYKVLRIRILETVYI